MPAVCCLLSDSLLECEDFRGSTTAHKYRSFNPIRLVLLPLSLAMHQADNRTDSTSNSWIFAPTSGVWSRTFSRLQSLVSVVISDPREVLVRFRGILMRHRKEMEEVDRALCEQKAFCPNDLAHACCTGSRVVGTSASLFHGRKKE